MSAGRCRQGDLVYGRPPVSKARLLPREQWVDDWVDTSADESLQDFKRDTHQRYGTVALWVPDDFFWVRDRNYLLLSRSLEFWVGACRIWRSRKTKIWEPTRRGLWTPGRWNPTPETFLASDILRQQKAPPA